MSNHIRTLAAAVALAIGLQSAPVFAYSDTSASAVNVDKTALALRGYDPVAYHTVGAPTKGKAEFSASHDGATYQFASVENRDTFVKDPARYAPQYGGFCAWAASQGYKADADPTAWKIVGGRLYVNYNAKVQRNWETDAAGLIKKADVRWSSIANRAPKDLK